MEASPFMPLKARKSRPAKAKARKKIQPTRPNKIAKLMYSPNLAARTLAAGKQLRIGLLFNDASNTFSSELLASSLEHARLNHVQIEVGKRDVAARLEFHGGAVHGRRVDHH